MPARFSTIILSTFVSTLLVFAVPLVAASQSKIAFDSLRDGNFEIYVMNPDGSNQTRLTNNPASDSGPSFNTRRGKIAFTSSRDGNAEIYVMNIDGSGQTRLTNAAGSDSAPAFSSDGRKVAFTSNRDGNSEIYVMNADGTAQQRLTNNTADESSPAFSPDGSKIAFTSNRDGDYEIYVVNADGTAPLRLTNISGSDIHPVFSPDGTWIAFTSYRSSHEQTFRMNANGTNQTLLSDTHFDPTISPDGTKVASVRKIATFNDIYVMSADGTNPIQLTASGPWNFSPSWSDDAALAPPALNNVSAAPVQVFEGGITTFSGNIYSANPTLSYTLTVNWGDGSEEIFSYPAGTSSFSETHTYLENLFDIPYTINATLTTANGNDSESTIVSVSNSAPSVSVVQPFPAVIGSPVNLHGIVSDPGSLDTHTVNINWGDGSSVTSLNLAVGVTSFSAAHTYSALGAYTINVSVTDDEGAAATPENIFVGVVPQPTSGKIAFASNFGGDNNIWLMNSNGTGQIALTQNPASDAYPNMSRDGRKIVFQSDRDGNLEIYSMSSNGDFQTRLTNNVGQDTEPVISPDGSKIAFATNRHGTYEIYIMNSDGSGQIRLTNNSVDDGQAEFSPDGTKIIFSRLSGAEAHIYTMNLDGTGQTPLTSGLLEINGYPSYSPNGQKIVFSRANLSHTNGEIYVMDANGANPLRLTTAAGNDLEAAFSPDGNKIAFRSERDGNAEIYIMDANGANQNRITFDGAGVTNFAPTWATVPVVNVDIPDDLAREQGSTLTVPIIVSDTTGKGVISYDFRLNFDPAVLSPQGVAFDKAGTLSTGFEVNSGTGTPGQVVISGFGSAPLTGAGTLLNLKFNVVGTPPTSSDLTLDPFTFNEGVPFAEISGGHVFVQGTIRGSVLYGTSATGVPNVAISAVGAPITATTTASDGTYLLGGFGPGAYMVTPTKTGDINGITALDASLISQFLVGAATLTNTQQTAAEVSGNGTVSSFDAALIAQYVVALPNNGVTGQWRFLPPLRSYAAVASLTSENYVAILMGEVSGNWSPTGGAALNSLRTSALSLATPNDQKGRRPPGPITLTLPSLRARPGDLVTVGVSVGLPSSAVQAYQFDVLYDPQILRLEATPVDTAGTLSSGLAAVTNASQSGRLRLAVYGANPVTTGGTLINLKFRVIGASGTSSGLTFNGLMLNEGNPAAEGKSGKITVRK